jgi:hypothetical protein
MNQRVLDKAGDILLGDWVDKSDNEQVDLEELLYHLKQRIKIKIKIKIRVTRLSSILSVRLSNSYR